MKLKAYIKNKDHISYSKIIDVEMLDIKNKQIYFNGTATEMGFGLVEVAKESEFDLLRYTGRTDIEENDIYDGHICQSADYPCTERDNYVIVVKYHEGEFLGIKRLKADVHVRGISEGIVETLSEYESLKIIGHIYLNAGLLKNVKK